ncbi:thioesterase II family protein [Fibrella aquatilis]|uniref:Thioesterase n=1 Tax=Fibrella aquatilis TaxID=2817059 RepID=A0A939G5A7_9BACT|nr:alpha/beta fold hydrolase [Fibrella aquatilis]MBO0931468.1 thioesterase [Fibrella aquatilis]
MNVFCIPYAGGNKHSYYKFLECQPEAIQLRCLDLPGRASRLNEPLLGCVDDLVDDLYASVKHNLDQPYAIYGHSMGAILAYLLARRINQLGLPEPVALILSGSKSPRSRGAAPERPLSSLPDSDLIEVLEELGGFPSELLRDTVFLDFYFPIIRADLKALEDYRYSEKPPLSIPFFVLAGDREKITPDELNAWQSETTAPIETARFSGGHFFIFDHCETILRLIAATKPAYS